MLVIFSKKIKLMEIVCVEKVLYRTMQKYGKALYGEKTKIKCDY